MSTNELFDILKEETTNQLSGTLTFEGSIIKWEYDAIDVLFDLTEVENHLLEISTEDQIIITDILDDLDVDDCIMTQLEFDETNVLFYLENE